MDEVDTEDLIPNSDEDWMTENEEQCLPTTPPKQYLVSNESNNLQSKLQFLGIGFLLIIASTYLLISLPLYLRAVDIRSDAYTLIFFTSTTTLLLLLLLTLITKKFFSNNDISSWSIFEPPVPFHYVMKIGCCLGISAFLIIYAVNEKRVMCHLQDPIKGIILVFSLIFYFFFCRKLMGLQRIFSCTTIIVGLFISVDYGLCDEFRCRGYERETRAEDAGDWSSRTHAFWSAIYILGLAFYAAHFTLLERCLVPVFTQPIIFASASSTLLSTVSRLVSSTDATPLTATQTSRNNNQYNTKLPKSIFSLTLWIHFVIWIIAIVFFWTDLLPTVGKSTNIHGFWNTTTAGLACHFQLPNHKTHNMPMDSSCGNVFIDAWSFVLVYTIFSVTLIKFTEMSQSAVFTVAMVTVALPIAGIWWSLFQMSEIHYGTLVWDPSVSGELICSLLGLPIVLLGVGLLYKSHFKEISENDDDCQHQTRDTNGIEHEYSSTSTGLA